VIRRVASFGNPALFYELLDGLTHIFSCEQSSRGERLQVREAHARTVGIFTDRQEDKASVAFHGAMVENLAADSSAHVAA
jgi:hypothetical protein